MPLGDVGKRPTLPNSRLIVEFHLGRYDGCCVINVLIEKVSIISGPRLMLGSDSGRYGGCYTTTEQEAVSIRPEASHPHRMDAFFSPYHIP